MTSGFCSQSTERRRDEPRGRCIHTLGVLPPQGRWGKSHGNWVERPEDVTSTYLELLVPWSLWRWAKEFMRKHAGTKLGGFTRWKPSFLWRSSRCQGDGLAHLDELFREENLFPDSDLMTLQTSQSIPSPPRARAEARIPLFRLIIGIPDLPSMSLQALIQSGGAFLTTFKLAHI